MSVCAAAPVTSLRLVGIVDGAGSAEGAAGLGMDSTIAEGIVGVLVLAHGRCTIFVLHRGDQIAIALIAEVGREIAFDDRRRQIAVRQIAIGLVPSVASRP